MINLNKRIFNQIKNHALYESPAECCGLLVETSGVLSIFPCQNIAQNTIINFKISYRDYLRATISGDIKAYYHSHAAPETVDVLTEKDKFISYNHKYPIVLYLLKEDEFCIFDQEQSKYIGLKFVWGEQDCVTLIQLFYKNEFNIDLPDESRDEMWYEKDPNKIVNNIDRFGFVKVGNEPLKVGDIIGIKIKQEMPSHLLIYVGNDQILHQRTNSYSSIEPYSDLLKNQTAFILRHQSKC